MEDVQKDDAEVEAFAQIWRAQNALWGWLASALATANPKATDVRADGRGERHMTPAGPAASNLSMRTERLTAAEGWIPAQKVNPR